MNTSRCCLQKDLGEGRPRGSYFRSLLISVRPFFRLRHGNQVQERKRWVYDRKQRGLLTQWSQGLSAGQVSSDPIISFPPWFPSSVVKIIIFALLPCGVAVHAMFEQDNHTKQYNNNHSQDKAELVCDSEKNHSQWLWSQ